MAGNLLLMTVQALLLAGQQPDVPTTVGPADIVDFNDPNIPYTWKNSNLFHLDVASGEAKLLKSFSPLGLKPNGPSCNQAGDRILVTTSADGKRICFNSSRSGTIDLCILSPALGESSPGRCERE